MSDEPSTPDEESTGASGDRSRGEEAGAHGNRTEPGALEESERAPVEKPDLDRHGRGPQTGDNADTDEAGVHETEDEQEGVHENGEEQAGVHANDERKTGIDDTAVESTAVDGSGEESDGEDAVADETVPDDVQKYQRFKKVDGAEYERVNRFLRDRTYITAREWAMARLCADFRTETGVEMTKIGENLPELVPFMTDTYSPQAVNQARSSFEDKVRTAGATFLYGAMSDFFTAEELDEVMYEVTEVAKFLLEVEGVDLAVDDELEAEDRISSVMREVRQASEALRYEECPSCGHDLRE